MREPALLGELRVSMGARKTVTTESTGRGARAIAANDVSRSMPTLSRYFKSPDVRRSFVHHAVMTTTAPVSACLVSRHPLYLIVLGYRGL